MSESARHREKKLAEIAEAKKRIEELRRKKEARATSGTGTAPQTEASRGVDDFIESLLSTRREPQPSDDGKERTRQRKQNHAAQLTKTRNVAEVSIAPKVAELYEKATQSVSVEPADNEAVLTSDGPRPSEDDSQSNRPALGPSDPPKHHASLSVGTQQVQGEDRNALQPPTEIADDERRRIVGSPDFSEFFGKTTKLIERLLGSVHYDAFVDYSGLCESDAEKSESTGTLNHVTTFADQKWSEGRPIHSVSNTPKFNELTVASYGKRGNASSRECDGCVLIWNMAMPHRPEFAFTSQSPVLTALVDRFNPHLVIGGSYSGSILMWDMRSKSGPVCRTPLSSRGHAHPVFSMAHVGTQNAHSLVTASTDGRLCQWSLSMLVNPQEYVDLKKGNRDVAATSIAFPENETNCLYVGAEDGSVVQAHVHGGNARAGVTEVLESHDGPVTALHFHPGGDHVSTGYDFNDLLLSSSFDWTLRLWSPKQFTQPLHVFESSEDYISDVQWHPSHQAAFATCDGEGSLDVWNLLADFETPSAHIDAGTGLNRLCWSRDGRRLVAGGCDGDLMVYQADKQLVTMRPDDAAAFDERIADLKPDAGATRGASH